MAAMRRKERGSSGWLVFIVMGTLASLVMGLVMVWINIERMDINYFINQLQASIRERQEHKAKLETEREFLLSPHELGRKSAALGMRQPSPGQVRRMNAR
jgi:cell division protein FtsL